jgi:CRP-like cAMP-binding protein
MSRPPSASDNMLLAGLPREDSERLLPYMRPGRLLKEQVLYEEGETPRYGYFPLSGMLSLLATTEDGNRLEVAMVGNEGMAGIQIILGEQESAHTVTVQIAADVLNIRAALLRDEFYRSVRFQKLFNAYFHTLLVQISQSAVCSHTHKIEERLCRWLLIARDRAHSDSFLLTHDIISQMLGAQRSSVTDAAADLQRRGLIRYSRGKMTIVDRQRLEAASCVCYHVITKELARVATA